MWSLSKNLELLCYPIGAIWLLLVAGGFSFLLKRKLAPAVYMLALALIMMLVGSTPLPAAALASMERPYARGKLDRAAELDAVIALGGALSGSAGDYLGADAGPSSDRLIVAAHLVKERSGAILVLGGGYLSKGGAFKTEGEAMAHLARSWGVGPTNVIALPPSANTHDEAVHFAHLAAERKWRRVALVTSAWHLRRAEAAFKKAGLQVVPVGCDFRGLGTLERGASTITPGITGFELLQLFIREQVGWQVYAWRGWI